MTRIVAIGECMVEMAPAGPDATFAMGFAGDTMNTAWYLRQLLPSSDQVDYLTAVGADAVSEQMLDFLTSAGIGTANVVRHPALTVGLYMIQLRDGERSFSYWRGQSAARTLADNRGMLADALGGAQIAYFSGITMAILPADARTRLLDTLRDFRAAGGTVVFDPNLRPKLWSSPDEMTETVMAAAACSDTVLPSYEDEAAWFGDQDTEATARRYADCGAGTVIVKNGASEMLAWENGHVSTYMPPPVRQVVDTTAAGDSFNAGYLAARLSGRDIADAMRDGAALAAKVIQSRGALVKDVS